MSNTPPRKMQSEGYSGPLPSTNMNVSSMSANMLAKERDKNPMHRN